ncbi:MAG: hypothetical protein Q4A14_08035, partial [Porphyromonas sp.]|nr:hypothetical protein [Porphyromonas sp.]
KGDKGDAGAKGESGEKGDTGAQGDRVTIGTDGFWYINGQKTTVKAAGEKGEPGVGKSAFQLWVEEVQANKILDKEGRQWPHDKVELNHFWEYLKGKDGRDRSGSATPLEKTPLKILSFEDIPRKLYGPKDPSVYPDQDYDWTKIVVETTPKAKVYYQCSGVDYYSGDGGNEQLTVNTVEVDNDGKCTIFIKQRYYSITVHIWAEETGKIPSYQHHLNVVSPRRDIGV